MTELRIFTRRPKIAARPQRKMWRRLGWVVGAVVALVGFLDAGLALVDRVRAGWQVTASSPTRPHGTAEQEPPAVGVESTLRTPEESLAVPSTEERAPAPEPPALRSSGRSAVQLPLNILVFDAVGSRRVLTRVVEELRRRYPSSTVDSQFDWKSKFRMSRTLIVWQGAENRPFAICLQQQFPGPQRAERRSWRWVFDAVRDVALFVGDDWRDVERGLRMMIAPCDRSAGPIWTLEEILECLEREHIRATYSAVAAVLQVSPDSVQHSLGTSGTRASWVVSAERYIGLYSRRPPSPQSRRDGIVIGMEADLLEQLDSCRAARPG